jgi:hypothetical protein
MRSPQTPPTHSARHIFGRSNSRAANENRRNPTIIKIGSQNPVKGREIEMPAFNIDANPFEMVLIIFPLITFVVSIIAQLLLKKKLWILGFVFILYLIATYTVFNSSFLMWCFVYTGISFIGTLIADLILKFRKKSISLS